MEHEYVDIAIVILEFLQDAEYHTITATTLHVAKHFHMTSDEINTQLKSRISNSNDPSFSSTKIYTETVLIVSQLRRAKFLKDFPKTKKIGLFTMTEKGLNLLKKNKHEIKKAMNLEINKYYKMKKHSKNYKHH